MQTLHIPVDYVQVVSAHRDFVYFRVGAAPGLEELHAGYDKHNERDIEIQTVTGNGVALVRQLGWVGPVDVTDQDGRRTVPNTTISRLREVVASGAAAPPRVTEEQ